jgi:hypothetical protein
MRPRGLSQNFSICGLKNGSAESCSAFGVLPSTPASATAEPVGVIGANSKEFRTAIFNSRIERF